MAIMIYRTSEGTQHLVGVADEKNLDDVQTFCARRNEEAKAAGYDSKYGYDRNAAAIFNKEQLNAR